MKKHNKIFRTGLIVSLIIFLIVYFIPIPYYISKPGMARELEPIVEVDGGSEAEGSFMLTTIQMGKANGFTYALANMLSYWTIYKEEEIKGQDETDNEYEMRQMYLMEGSKEKAIISAFKAAGEEYRTMYNGIYVYRVVEGMPAAGVLQAGDRITKINQKKIESTSEFTEYIVNQKEGAEIDLELVRNDEIVHKSVEVKMNADTGKVGIGIVLVDDIEVETNPKVEIDSSEIGGPSAGLMFSLEVYNQLVEEDITKGYSIAGTGTIDEEGIVGAIGGIDQKVVAADKSGADIFFAPYENGEENSNYSVAVKTAKDIGTSMKIVPIDTMAEALDYLANLEEKK